MATNEVCGFVVCIKCIGKETSYLLRTVVNRPSCFITKKNKYLPTSVVCTVLDNEHNEIRTRLFDGLPFILVCSLTIRILIAFSQFSELSKMLLHLSVY